MTKIKKNVKNVFYIYGLSCLNTRAYKYHLSIMNPRDGIVLQTELDDHCDKLAVDRRKYCQLR